jgi:hypothetical protein
MLLASGDYVWLPAPRLRAPGAEHRGARCGPFAGAAHFMELEGVVFFLFAVELTGWT